MDRVELKAKLKAFEKEFKTKNGRNPTQADIKLNPSIAKDYKLYNSSKPKSIPPPPPVLPPRALTPPPPIKSTSSITILPADPRAWERVFNIGESQTLSSTIEDSFGPSPIKPSASGQPFVPLFIEERSIASTSTSTLFSKFKASSTVTEKQDIIIRTGDIQPGARGVKRLADDPEKKDFEFELPVKDGKKSRYDNSQANDEQELGITGKYKGKGKGKAVVSKTKNAVKKVVKKSKKALTLESDDDAMLGVVKEGAGVRTRKTKDEKGRIVLELEFGDDDENDQENDQESGEEEEISHATSIKALKSKKKKVIIHSRRPYNVDSKSILPNSTIPAAGELDAEEEEEEVRDTTTLFYQDSFDLISSQSVFTPSEISTSQATYDTSDEDDNPPSPSTQNLSPLKKSQTRFDNELDSLDPTLLETLSLRSPTKKQCLLREKERDLVVKHLLMDPIERNRNTKRAAGLEELILSEMRAKGLGTKLEEVEVDSDEDGWASEVEGWKLEDFEGRMDADSTDD